MLFSEIIGQYEVKKRLINSVRENRVSHTQLFLGPEGNGKLALAIAYAQYINCLNKKDHEACNTCSSCIKFNKLIHPDLHFIYPTSSTKEISKPTSIDFIKEWRTLVLEKNAYFNTTDWYQKIKIEKKQGIINARDANDIIKRLSYKSYEAEYKVMIIWMVERLFHAAAPKLLKILEEPPDKTLIILIAENHHMILNTILSRTQMIKIPSIEEEALTKKLIHDGHQSKEVASTVPLSEGNYLKAQQLLKNEEVEKYNYNTFVQWMRLCYTLNMKDIAAFSDEMNRNSRDSNKAFLTYALNMVRNSLLANFKHPELIKLGEKEKTWLTELFFKYINPQNGIAISQLINNAIYYIERNAHASILFFDLTLKISQLLPRKK